MTNLNKIVNNLIKEHEGGEVFFDNLDASVRNFDFIEQLIDKLNRKENDIIVSGKFGIYFTSICAILYIKPKNIILVNGSLRKGESVIDISLFNVYHRNFVFIDDSFYSGKTRNSINEELQKYGSKIIRTIVCYDGSKEKDDTVDSLYRYYK